MADRGGPYYGDGRPEPPRPRPRRYAYGVPSDDDGQEGREVTPEGSRISGHENGSHGAPGQWNGHPGAPVAPPAPGPGPAGYGGQMPQGPSPSPTYQGPPPHQGGAATGNPGHAGQYAYTEPFDYSAPPSNGAPPRPGAPVSHGAPHGAPAPNGAPPPVGAPPPNGARPGPYPGRWPDETRETMALRGPFRGAPEPGPVPERSGLLADGEEGQSQLRRPGQGRADRRRAAKRIKRRRRLSATKEIPILIGVALLIALVLKTFLVQAFVIPSGSMEQTIKIGDRVLVDKLTPWFGSKPERGDVVVFRDPGGWLEHEQGKKKDDPVGIKQGKELLTFIGLLPSDDEQDLIKRVVGVGGDTVRCCDKQGRVTVNGTPLDEPYLHPGNKPSLIDFKVTVPVGRVFVMGDHRSSSADSRYHLKEPGKGMVSEDLVLGKAVVIAWPFDHWQRLEEPGTYASVPDARGATASASGAGDNRVVQLPFSAELPLVMGVVGLYRLSGRRQRSVRSGCGGLGGRRTVRFRRSGR